MKALKIELKMWLSEKLLGWSFCVAPSNEEGEKLKALVLSYMTDKILEIKKGNEI